LKGQIENIAFEQDVDLTPNESKDVTFTPDKFAQLNIANPHLWWPAQMGEPHLYRLGMQFEVNGTISDRAETQFGIREITSDLNSIGGRAFHVNGKNILIRGGGWTTDMMLRENSQRLHDEFRYVATWDSTPSVSKANSKPRNFSISPIAKESSLWPVGAAAISGSAGPAGSRKITKSPNNLSAIRSIACAAIPA
jgi:hypothetical protein